MIKVYFDEPDRAGFYTREGQRLPDPKLVDAFGGVNGVDGCYYVQTENGDWVEGNRPTADQAVAAAATAANAWVGPKGPPGLPPKRRAYRPRKSARRFAMLGFFMNYHALALPPLAVKCWVILWREHRPHEEHGAASIVSIGSLVERSGGHRRNVQRMLELLKRNGYVHMLKPGGPHGSAERRTCLPSWWMMLVRWID